MPRPKAPGAGRHGTPETTRARKKKGKKGNPTKSRRKEEKRKNRGGGGRKKEITEKGGSGGPQDAKAQGTPGRKTRRVRDNGGTRKVRTATTTRRTTPAWRGPSKQRAHRNRPQEKVRRTKTRLGGRPARPRQEGHAQAHTRDPSVASSAPREAVSASIQNSPGAAAGSPVDRREVRETRRVSDRGVTRQPPPRTQPKTNAGGTRQGQPHRGAANRYDAEHKEPGSRPASTCSAQPPSKTGGSSPHARKSHHGVGKADQSTESDRTS